MSHSVKNQPEVWEVTSNCICHSRDIGSLKRRGVPKDSLASGNWSICPFWNHIFGFKAEKNLKMCNLTIFCLP